MSADLHSTLGARLRQLRAEAALSQHSLAERAEVSTEFISRMERGTTLPSLPTLIKLCEVLRCTPNDLLLPASRTKDRFEDLRRRLERAAPPVARHATRVAEAVLEYESKARDKSGKSRPQT